MKELLKIIFIFIYALGISGLLNILYGLPKKEETKGIITLVLTIFGLIGIFVID